MNRYVLIVFIFVLAASSADVQTTYSELEADLNLCKSLVASGDSEALSACIEKAAAYILLFDPDSRESAACLAFLSSVPENLKTPQTQLSLAHLDMISGRPKKASERYLDLILTYPASQETTRHRIALARAFRESGDFSQGVAQLDQLLKEKSAALPWVQLERARIYRAQGEQENALRLYQQIQTANLNSYVTGIVESEMDTILFTQVTKAEETH